MDETMMGEPLKNITDTAVQSLYKEKTEKYRNCLKVYTDWSKLSTERERGKSAAAWVCDMAEPRVNEWKLPEYVSNFGAEMNAIMRATEWYVGQESE